MRKRTRLDGGGIVLCSVVTLLSCARPAAPLKTAGTAAPDARGPGSAPGSPPPAGSLAEGAPLALTPAATARAMLVATFLAPTLDRAVESALALVRKASPLPLDAAQVRDMALGELGISPEVSRQLDLGAPVSGALVGGGQGVMHAAFTFAVKPGVDPQALLRSVGRVVRRRGAALEIESNGSGGGSGHRWFLPVGSTVVVAESDQALAEAANLALEARRPAAFDPTGAGGASAANAKNPKDDLAVMVYPDSLARAAGTDVKTATEAALSALDELAAAGGSKMGPEGRYQLRELIGYAADIAAAELAVDVDADRGVVFLLRLRPKAESRLQAISRNVSQVPVDPLLLAKGEAGMVLTSAYTGQTIDQLRRQITRLPAAGKDVAAGRRLLTAMADGLVGTLSAVGRMKSGASMEIVYPVKDAAAGGKIQAALLGSGQASLTALMKAATQGEAVDMKVKRVRVEGVGKARALRSTIAFSMPGDTKGVLKKLFGPAGIDVYAAVLGGDRLVMTMGPDAKAHLAAMASLAATPKPGKAAAKGEARTATPPPGTIADAIAASNGRSLYYYLDLREGLAVAAAMVEAGDPRLGMLAGALRTPIPILGGVAGDAEGRALKMDLTIPPACIVGIGALITAFGMPMGASSSLSP